MYFKSDAIKNWLVANIAMRDMSQLMKKINFIFLTKCKKCRLFPKSILKIYYIWDSRFVGKNQSL